MSRNKEIACIILGILVCGILVTSFTSSLLREQERGLAASQDSGYAGEEELAQARLYGTAGVSAEMESLPAEDGEEYTGAAPEAAGLSGGAENPADGAEAGEIEAAADGAEAGIQTAGTGEVLAEAEASPASPAAGSQAVSGMTSSASRARSGAGDEEQKASLAAAESSAAESIAADDTAGPGISLAAESGGTVLSEEKKTAADFKRRLEEIDRQIEDQRARNETYTTYDMWTMAENERKLWDGELNNIYSTVKDHLPSDQVEALVKDERAWIVERDAKASEDAGKYEGGTLESVEYSASLAASTRARAYELVETYGDYLW